MAYFKKLNREQIFGILAFIFLVWAVFVTLYAVRLQTRLESQARPKAFSLRDLGEHPDLKKFFESPEWQAFENGQAVQGFLNSSRFQQIAASPQWQALKSSPALANFVNSQEVKNIGSSMAWKDFGKSQSVQGAKVWFKSQGQVGREGRGWARDVWQSREFSNLLGSWEVRQLVRSPSLASFAKSREVRDFASLLLRERVIDPQTGRLAPEIQAILASTEFRNLVESQLGPGSLNTPFKDLFSEKVLGVWQQEQKETGSRFGNFFGNFFERLGIGGRIGGFPGAGFDKSTIIKNLLSQLLSSLNLGADNPPFGSSEVLRTDASGNVTLVRVFIPADTDELIASMAPGVYVYLIGGSEGVVVWDGSYLYPASSMLSVFASFSPNEIISLLTGGFDLKTLMEKIGERCQNPSSLTPMPASEKILEAVEKHFPGKKISQIGIPHWHIDHAENAPQLQQMAADKWGFKPPLRIGTKDKFYPDDDNGDGILGGEGDSIGGAESVFAQACYKPGDWEWGQDLVDGEQLIGTGYILMEASEHTYGNFRVYSDIDQVGITDGFLTTDELEGNPFMDILKALAQNELFSQLMEPLKVIFLENPAGSMPTWEKYKKAVVDKGYPSFWLHFPDETPADQMHPPPEW